MVLNIFGNCSVLTSGYVDVFRCVEKATGKIAFCSEANIATHKDFVRSFFEAAVSVICGEYNEHSDRCDRYQRVQLNEADKKNDSSLSYQRPPSYFGPLVHNLANL